MSGSKREAQRALAALVGEVSAGKHASTAATVSELLTRWSEHIDDQLSPTTVREYRRLVGTMLEPRAIVRTTNFRTYETIERPIPVHQGAARDLNAPPRCGADPV